MVGTWVARHPDGWITSEYYFGADGAVEMFWYSGGFEPASAWGTYSVLAPYLLLDLEGVEYHITGNVLVSGDRLVINALLPEGTVDGCLGAWELVGSYVPEVGTGYQDTERVSLFSDGSATPASTSSRTPRRTDRPARRPMS